MYSLVPCLAEVQSFASTERSGTLQCAAMVMHRFLVA